MPAISAKPTEVEFGKLEIGTRGEERRIRITNEGEAPLIVRAVRLGGEDSGDFNVSEKCTDKAIKPGDRCEIRVGFTPRGERSRRAAVVVSHNAGGGLLEIALLGTGIKRPSRTSISASPTNIDFGEQMINSVSKPRPVKFTNQGSAPYQVSRVTLVDNSAGGLLGGLLGVNQGGNFRVVEDGCRGTQLVPGGNCTVLVVFAPRDRGGRNGSLSLENASVSLRGTAVGSQQGWCCSDNEVFASTPEQCKRVKGVFFDDESTARRRCRAAAPTPAPPIFRPRRSPG